jgi:hypothetical protein
VLYITEELVKYSFKWDHLHWMTMHIRSPKPYYIAHTC